MRKIEVIPLSELMEIISEVEKYFDELGWPKSYGGVEACEKIKAKIKDLKAKAHGGNRA